MDLFFLFWLILGALIGVTAAQRKGFSIVGGVIGGLMLGILSPLMFLVSPSRQKCPHCAEWIKEEAKICPHCQREVLTRASADEEHLFTTSSARRR